MKMKKWKLIMLSAFVGTSLLAAGCSDTNGQPAEQKMDDSKMMDENMDDKKMDNSKMMDENMDDKKMDDSKMMDENMDDKK
ncbi:hypothetical protein ACFO25_12915 [Paenactinomyces guangxiensis]|uniref:Pentapeptide MXKDX repeat protein n=1 Tax=Paenactinomyces guangxiensis TaxID=1490290 RepID=A0A7W1WRN9_9BACL|nr:hypothetical protein [Paenactinomyces guangxiensis]MBA4494636.1 hypothetical protein [Paenactinomyces guangxiensis]MBH8591601.1 hypothetical protein [Paenactinomyces guangxiensis]